jgi:hypothetical protein
MAHSDFLNVDLGALCDDLASAIDKTYQRLPWALKQAAVARLKRQAHHLSQEVQKAQDSKGASPTQRHLREALSMAHECVPLLSLCLKKNLLSPELHDRWVKQLGVIEQRLEEWMNAGSA